jgi:hypothetical protein
MELTQKEKELHGKICFEACEILVQMINLMEKYKGIDLKFNRISGSENPTLNGQMSYTFDVEKLKLLNDGKIF